MAADVPEHAAGMRDYWDARARENAVWYVDTSTAYDHPDMGRFLSDGRQIVATALGEPQAQPAGHELAVEIGSGLGRICLALRKHFHHVIGVDISSEMVQRARRLVDDEHIDFVVGDGTTLSPLEDGCADFVISFTVLQHLPRRDLIGLYLGEAARVLRPGGVLAVQWNSDAHPVRYRIRTFQRRVLARLGLAHRDDRRLAPQFVGTPAPVSYVRGELEASGLRVVSVRGEGTLFTWIWARRP